MNKLAVLAFSLLLFFGAMLWYLADSSLNDFIKGQVVLQGDYYTGQTTKIKDVSFSQASGTGVLQGITLSISKGNSKASMSATNKPSNDPHQQPTILSINTAKVTFDSNTLNSELINIKNIEIDSLEVWLTEQEGYSKAVNNLTQLQQHIATQLLTIIPEVKPSLPKPSYVKDDGKGKKNRGKIQTKIHINSVFIHEITLNIQQGDTILQSKHQSIRFANIGTNDGIISNQLAAILLNKILKKSLSLADKKSSKQ